MNHNKNNMRFINWDTFNGPKNTNEFDFFSIFFDWLEQVFLTMGKRVHENIATGKL